MSDTHGKFVWYELLTPDTAAAAKFYHDVIGWNAKDSGMPGVDFEYTIFEVPNHDRGIAGMLPLAAEMKAQGIPPNWSGYVAVDDVDATAAKFVDLGGKIWRPAADIPGVGRFAVVADLHGAAIIVFKPAPMDGPPPEDLPMGTPGANGWHELYAGDAEEALEFYSKVFGWTKDSEMDMGPLGKYLLFAHNGKMIGGIMTKEPNIPVPCWGYYFCVDSIDAALERVTSAGGQVLNGPMEVPGDAWVIQCTDPQGAYFSLVGGR